MIKIIVTKQSNYPLSTIKIKKNLESFFKEHGIVSDAFCNVSIVNEKKMLELGRLYYKDKKLHSVFSFVESEVKGFKLPPNTGIFLGEIVLCFPQTVIEAKKENKLIEKKALELINHSALHLLGIHHKE